jgi:hypothetical protein
VTAITTWSKCTLARYERVAEQTLGTRLAWNESCGIDDREEIET